MLQVNICTYDIFRCHLNTIETASRATAHRDSCFRKTRILACLLPKETKETLKFFGQNVFARVKIHSNLMFSCTHLYPTTIYLKYPI